MDRAKGKGKGRETKEKDNICGKQEKMKVSRGKGVKMRAEVKDCS